MLLLAGLCMVGGGRAHASLFSDDEARKQIQQVDARVSGLEEAGKKQTETNNQQTELNSQQTRTLLDLQSQIDGLNTELRKLRGLNEELAHKLEDADKRQKDFYIELDSRVRHLESTDPTSGAQPAADGTNAPPQDDPTLANRSYEAAHKLFKAAKYQDAINAFQEFLKKFPASVYVPDAHFETGAAYYALNNFRNALVSYQLLETKYSFSPKAAEAMLLMADCQQKLKDAVAAKKTLKQLIAKYPDSEAAIEGKKRLTHK